MTYKTAHGQDMAVIVTGASDAPSCVMVHGGPGYYWRTEEVHSLGADLAQKERPLYLQAVQGRGCGDEIYASPNDHFSHDGLLERAEDLKAFGRPDILLGHSTGAMITLTAVMEGFIQPEKLVLVAPYTGALGEQKSWLTTKAEQYPQAFDRFSSFMDEKWTTYKGDKPDDFRENMYVHWGELFFSLREDDKLLAALHYHDFHVVDCLVEAGRINGEPYNAFKLMLDDPSEISTELAGILAKNATINAHWWRQDYVGTYPFLDKLSQHDFPCDVVIVSGEGDTITPPATVKQLAAVLNIKAQIASGANHLMESDQPGCLKDAVTDILVHTDFKSGQTY